MTTVLEWLRGQVSRTAHLCMDSRQISQGDVFIACPGVSGDGRRYVDAAIQNGAAAVVLEAQGLDSSLLSRLQQTGTAALSVEGLRTCLGELASAWYDHPSQRLAVLAVTGTNGKTSCTQWLAQALNAQGRP